MPDMLCRPHIVFVARIDGDEMAGGLEESVHVGIEHRIFNEMVDYIERQCQIGRCVLRQHIGGEECLARIIAVRWQHMSIAVIDTSTPM